MKFNNILTCIKQLFCKHEYGACSFRNYCVGIYRDWTECSKCDKIVDMHFEDFCRLKGYNYNEYY